MCESHLLALSGHMGEFTQPRAHLLAVPCRSQVKRYPSHQSKPQGTTALTRVNTTLASCKRSLRGRTSICRKSSLTRRALAQSAVRLGRRSRPAGIPRRSGIRCPGVGSSTEAGRSSAINISVADQLWPPNQQHERESIRKGLRAPLFRTRFVAYLFYMYLELLNLKLLHWSLPY